MKYTSCQVEIQDKNKTTYKKKTTIRKQFTEGNNWQPKLLPNLYLKVDRSTSR